MKLRNLFLMSALLLAFAPITSAQHSSLRSARARHVSVATTIGKIGLQFALGGHSRPSHRVSSRYVSSTAYAPTRVWIEGQYRTDYKKEWVNAYQEKRWIDAIYETRYDSCGKAYRVLARDGYWTQVTIPARYENRAYKTWVPGHYENHR